MPLRASNRAASSRAVPASSSASAATGTSAAGRSRCPGRCTGSSPWPSAVSRCSSSAPLAAKVIASAGDGGSSSHPRCRSSSSSPRASLPVNAQNVRWSPTSDMFAMFVRCRRYARRCASRACSRRPVCRYGSSSAVSTHCGCSTQPSRPASTGSASATASSYRPSEARYSIWSVGSQPAQSESSSRGAVVHRRYHCAASSAAPTCTATWCRYL
ncbi:hypothetical protein C6W10_29800 [Plantactinospora sp. BB1]|nr:hypothetical protein C6W10_29800 [Plantactinospora sp. BB1]